MDTILFLGPYTGFHPTRAFTIFRASEWDPKIIFGISKLFRQIPTVSPGKMLRPSGVSRYRGRASTAPPTSRFYYRSGLRDRGP